MRAAIGPPGGSGDQPQRIESIGGSEPECVVAVNDPTLALHGRRRDLRAGFLAGRTTPRRLLRRVSAASLSQLK